MNFVPSCRARLSFAAALLFTGAYVPAVVAQGASGYPSKPVRFVVGQSPGGATDIVARLIAQGLTERLRQTVFVENRTGAAGSIGATFVAKSAPDGHTALVVSSSYAINPSVYKKLPFDPVKDLAPVSLIAEAPFLLVVHPSLPVRSVKELIAFVRARPGELNYASGGIGSSGHLAGELLVHLAKLDLVHVPFKGAGPARIDVMTGQVHMTFTSVLSSLPHVKSGKLRALAVTSAKRSAAIPDLPTMDEAGVKGYRRTTWYAVLAPAETPGAIVAKLSAAVRNVVQSAEVRKRLLVDGAEPEGSSPQQFHDFLITEIAVARDIIKRAGIRK
jgi:tripartite-type tricarboxylate transporter receptor subunit TctC